ncbi:MAG TPA: PP0621 family protein [Burkholderiaceae bacterium]|nr:PP0621 family protein [Burkholderiaceae bacterium]
MGRILFWLLIGFAVYLGWRWWQIQQRRLRGAGERAATAARDGEKMVACQVCGLNLPQSEALLDQGRVYCCEEHRRSGADR